MNKKFKKMVLLLNTLIVTLVTGGCKQKKECAFEEFFREYTKNYENKIQEMQYKSWSVSIEDKYSFFYNSELNIETGEVIYSSDVIKIKAKGKYNSKTFAKEITSFVSYINGKKTSDEENEKIQMAYDFVLYPQQFSIDSILQLSNENESNLYYWAKYGNTFSFAMDTDKEILKKDEGMCYTYADNGAFVPLNKVYLTLRDDYKDAKFYINPYSIEVNVNNVSKCYEINDDCLITKNSISFDYQLDNGAIDRSYSNIEFKF